MDSNSVKERIKYYVDTGITPQALINCIAGEYNNQLPTKVIIILIEMIANETLTIGKDKWGQSWCVVTAWSPNRAAELNANKSTT